MTKEEFKKLCKLYLPDCKFVDGKDCQLEPCGLMCYRGHFTCTSTIVALLPRGEFAVYDKWRDVTITADLDYVKDWLEHCSGGKK